MRENVLSPPTRVLVVIILTLFVILPALENIVALRVKFPLACFLVIPGTVLLAIAKTSLFRQGMWISFGDRKMSGRISNCYRLGYYLIFWGLFLTFL